MEANGFWHEYNSKTSKINFFKIKEKLYYTRKNVNLLMFCGCRCIKCKSPDLNYFEFIANDGFDEVHHTCKTCGTHFNHLDGDIYDSCIQCNFTNESV